MGYIQISVEANNEDISSIVRSLHEHTIEDVDELLALPEFTQKYFSPAQTEHKRQQSKRLREHIMMNSSKKSPDMKTLKVLEVLRSIIENLYRKHLCSESDSSTVLSDDNHSLLNIYFRELCSARNCEEFDVFRRFGGVYVLIDVLVLYHRLYSKEFTESWQDLPAYAILLMRRLAYHFIEVAEMTLTNRPLMSALVYCYSRGFMKQRILHLFSDLSRLNDPSNDYYFHRSEIVKHLTENSIVLHTVAGESKETIQELVDNLEALSELTLYSEACKNDLLEVDGSMDLLIDLFEEPLGKFELVDAAFRESLRRGMIVIPPCTIILHLFALLIISFKKGTSLINTYENMETGANCACFIACFLGAVAVTSINENANSIYYPKKTFYPAGNILLHIAANIHDHPKALERFRQRDVCAVLTNFLKHKFDHDGDYIAHMCKEYTIFRINRPAAIIVAMDKHRPEVEVEKQRLRTLGAHDALTVLNRGTYLSESVCEKALAFLLKK